MVGSARWLTCVSVVAVVVCGCVVVAVLVAAAAAVRAAVLAAAAVLAQLPVSSYAAFSSWMTFLWLIVVYSSLRNSESVRSSCGRRLCGAHLRRCALKSATFERRASRT